ncbi:MAG: redoxin family protein [Caulobacterales bacterium]|nr:redoxin family protein [Caulobacterales bacterium]
MSKALITALATTAAAALLYGCAGGGEAPNALASSAPTAAMAEENVSVPVPTMAANFMLADTDYMGHELYRMSDAKAVVIVTQGNSCPISRAMAPALKALKAKYEAQGVQFLMLNSSIQDSRDAIAKEKAEYGFDVPILMDSNQLVGEQLGVTRTAEFFVIDPKTWKVAYRGPLDDRQTYGSQAGAAGHAYAADAIEAVLAGKQPVATNLQSPGCLVDFPGRAQVAATRISYSKDVAPILEKKCVACHQEGGIGPFAMSGYDMVKGFSPMIREVLRTHRMPPWNVDPHVGKFANDKSLSPDEIKTIVHWIDQGAERGAGPDPLAAKRRVAAEWPLGKPDLILEIPAYTVPASGVVDYQRPIIVNPLTEGKWLRATTFKVDQRQAVHHFLSGYLSEVPKDGVGNEARWGSSVGGYAVGSESTLWPKNVGTYLPPGGAIGIQAHYTPFGKQVTDKSVIGLYFYKDGEKPGLVMHNSVLVNPQIVIPAGEARHEEITYIDVPKEMLLYSAFPHAHYRGYASDLWVQYPDGTKKMLLAMPRYDFNWQREYTFAEPLKIPPGSKLIAHYWYDNSKQNPANPDPTRTVPWGDQSWDEMFYTAIRYRWTEETSSRLVDYDRLIDKTRLLGMFDANMDGKIEKSELKADLGEKLKAHFAQIDKDGDGGISLAELQAIQGFLGGPRQAQRQPPAASAPVAAAPAAKPGGR